MKKRKECIAMLLAGGQGSRLLVLTEKTAKPAVAFGGKYRIIDFPLSSCVHSGIDTVGILTQYQPKELNAYIGTGQPWGLNRNFGGAHILPPYVKSGKSEWYQGTANAIYQNIPFIEDYEPAYVLILSADHIYKMDYSRMLAFHKASGSECTIAVREVPLKEASRFGIMSTDRDGRITEFEEKPRHPKSTKASMGIYIFNRSILKTYLQKDEETATSAHDFGKNVIPALLKDGRVLFAYPFSGYWRDVGTVDSLWEANMDLLDPENGLNLRDPRHKIFSRSYALPPSLIAAGATLKNALVAEGCRIYGRVEDSVVSGGAVIERGATVRHSVVMPGAYIGRDSVLDHAIVGENTKIGRGVHIGGERQRYPHESFGIAVVGRGKTVPDGTVVEPKEII